ncbi:DUF7282 domain-containing protein [Salinimicrobium sp. HB62]|uniref:DUF7282 domain-containing protein n=1 Tax=Salinimicrobium sp. HB62 TaxID=3077781 RepID=UPI002D767496|nr:hypothetical protein [Salinimicrobium sp. HB62]
MKLKKFYLLMLPMILSLGLVACSDDDDDVIDPGIPPTGSIVVDDEVMVENGTITINSVSMSNPGWVVLHRDNNGSPMVPEIISVPERVESGPTQNVTIELADGEEVTDGETLWVMLHTDGGILGTYEFETVNDVDAPITDAQGNVVAESFMVSVEGEAVSSFTANDQDLVNGVVYVESITMEQDGYVVIHASNEAGDGPMVPEIISEPVYLEAGTYSNVGVPLTDEANVEAGDTLWIMLHEDTGEEGVYEFDGENGLDLPIMDGDNVVVSPITINNVTTADMSGSITVSDQALVDNTITIDNIQLDMDGWVVVHASNEAGDGPMVPEIISEPVYLEEMDNNDVVITFNEDANLAAGDTVWVMLHDDTGVEGVYEFDGMNGLDMPITDDDGVVVVPVTLQ